MLWVSIPQWVPSRSTCPGLGFAVRLHALGVNSPVGPQQGPCLGLGFAVRLHALGVKPQQGPCLGLGFSARLHALGVKPQQEHMPGFGCIVLLGVVAKNTPLYAGRKRNF